MGELKPNSIKPEDIQTLEDWQLIVAACHFGPAMGDCIEADYGYTIEGGVIYCHDRDRKFDLTDDIEADKPLESLERYGGFSWRDYARERIADYVTPADDADTRPASPLLEALDTFFDSLVTHHEDGDDLYVMAVKDGMAWTVKHARAAIEAHGEGEGGG